jgi:hypothetical protein
MNSLRSAWTGAARLAARFPQGEAGLTKPGKKIALYKRGILMEVNFVAAGSPLKQSPSTRFNKVGHKSLTRKYLIIKYLVARMKSDFQAEGRWFEPSRAYHLFSKTYGPFPAASKTAL